MDKLWHKLDEDKSAAITWFEFLESVGQGDFHSLGLQDLFKGKALQREVEQISKILIREFKQREMTEAENLTLYDEIEDTLMVQDVCPHTPSKVKVVNLAQEQVRMLEILFNTFDFKGKGKMPIDDIRLVLKVLDRWDEEACIEALDDDNSGKVDWKEVRA